MVLEVFHESDPGQRRSIALEALDSWDAFQEACRATLLLRSVTGVYDDDAEVDDLEALQDGDVLCSLADAAMPGVAAPLVGASPAIKLAAFATACRQLGVREDEALPPGALLPGPARSAEALVSAIAALAREAAARKLLPPLDP